MHSFCECALYVSLRAASATTILESQVLPAQSVISGGHKKIHGDLQAQNKQASYVYRLLKTR